MYSMKPIHQASEKLDFPEGIYKMKNIHSDGEEIKKEDLTPAMKALEERQLSILKRLEMLKKQVTGIDEQLGRKFGDSVPEDVQCVRSKVDRVQSQNKKVVLPEGTLDFVISVSTNQTSLSPLLLGDLMKERGVKVAIPTHIHSSCSIVPQTLLDAYSDGKATGRMGTSTTAKVFLTIVFKEDPFCPSVMYSPLLQTRIIGDVNIARYLCRLLLPDIYDDNDANTVASIDGWLDAAGKVHHGNTKEKDAVLKKLNAHLGVNSSGYLCKERLTLADITLLSALLSNITSFKSLPKNVKGWFKKCSTRFSSLKNIDVPSGWKE